jgi:hypothetical protein
MALEAVGIGVMRGADLLQHGCDIRRIRDQPTAFYMGVRLADEPGLVVPRSAAALAGDALDMAGFADIVGAEGDELALRADFDAVAAFCLLVAMIDS